MKQRLFLVFCLLIGFGYTYCFAQEIPVEQADAGIKVVIPDTWVFNADQDNKGNWEPFTSIFGDGTMLVGANTFPEGEDGMNMKVAFADPKTGTVETYWAFYTDAGLPWSGPFNEVRNDGNPARVAADPRSGGTRYIVGMESTPYLYDEFNTGDRWVQNFGYDDRVAAVQIFNKTANGPSPITNCFDPIYQPGNLSGDQNAAQMRFGGDLEFLSNGNILVVIEDRTKNVVTTGNGSVAAIFNGETGALIKGPFNAAGDGASHDQWSNVAAFNGGFCVRATNVFTVFDNDGNMKYWFTQDAFSSVAEQGRGDGVRIGSNINIDYVYFTGKDANGEMVVSRFNAVATTSAEDLKDVNEEYVNETDFIPGTFDRADIGVDGVGNFCVVYTDSSVTGTNQVIGRVFDNTMKAATSTFFIFQYHDGYTTADVVGYESKHSNCTMSNDYILVAAKGLTWDESSNGLSPANQTFFTVLENPLRQSTAVKEWELF